MSRREFDNKTRALAFKRAGGNCEKCTARLSVGKFRYDHILPDFLGGEPTLENCQVICAACDEVKTYTQDIPRIAKTKRQHAKHIGASKRSTFPCSRDSKWKKKIDGSVVSR